MLHCLGFLHEAGSDWLTRSTQVVGVWALSRSASGTTKYASV